MNMIKSVWLGMSAALVVGGAVAQAPPAAVELNIPQQALSDALNALANQTGLQVVFAMPAVEGAVAPSVKGSYTPDAALEKMLQNTGLRYEYLDARTVAVMGKEGSPPATTAANGNLINMAQAEEQTIAPSQADNGRLEEIVVTAQKRVERLQDVPVPVTVVSGETLVNSNQLRIQDYYTRIPGLNVTPADGRGGPRLTIRGITTGGVTNPTVGVVVDDVPYGGSTNTALGYFVPDIDPSDLARVEVLRGPQGTLYGASSIGGLLNFVTVDPSTEAVSGRIQAGASGVHNGDGAGYGVRGAVNLPISEDFAIRASGFTRRDPGYIDDPVLGIDGVNETKVSGGRFSALWRPSESFSVKLSAMLQDSDRDGANDVPLNSGLGELQRTALLNTGTYDLKASVYSLNVKGKLGRVDVAAISGYSINKLHTVQDLTPLLGACSLNGCGGLFGLVPGFTGFGVTGVPYVDSIETKKFTQELRFSSSIGERMEWLLGAFYNNEKTQSETDLLAQDPTGNIVGSGLHLPQNADFTEYAVFADLTFKLTDRLDIQVGGRQSHNKQSTETFFSGPYTPIFTGGNASPFIWPLVETKEDAFTYLLTPRFKISPDLMLYARLASGYRPGGPNTVAAIAPVPSQFDPDKTFNYEIGFKGSALEHRLSFSASVYYIDWKDIQVFVAQAGNSFNSNGSRAKSQGVELSMDVKPLPGMTASAWVAWNDAELTEDPPAGAFFFARPGDRLPYSSPFSGQISLDQEFSITSGVTGFAGASVSYVDERDDVFSGNSSIQRQSFPSYAQTDVYAGARYNSWTLNLFANNITDKRGALSGDPAAVVPVVTYIQPRTIGLSVARTF
jgi:outer membrane receptor protein involved in Fe transport